MRIDCLYVVRVCDWLITDFPETFKKNEAVQNK